MRAVPSQASLALHLPQEAHARGPLSSGRVVLYSKTNSPPCLWSQAVHVKGMIPTLANQIQQDANQQLTESSARRWSWEGSETSRQGAADVFVPCNEHCKSDKTPTKHHRFHSHFVGRWTFGGVGWSQFLKECHHFKENIIYVGAKEISYWERWLKGMVACLTYLLRAF